MGRFSISSLRVRLLLLVLLILAPAAGLMVYTAVEQRRLAATAVQENALRLIRPISAEYERMIEATHQLLMVLARLPEVQNREPAACSELFESLLARHPFYANLGAVEPDGDLFCSALPVSAPLSLADRSYIQRALRTQEFAVGDYQVGYITGKASVNFGYPAIGDRGRVRAVVYAALDLTQLNDLASAASLPPGSVVTLVDRRGTILARSLDSQKWVGYSLKAIPLIRTLLHQRLGVTEMEGLDGVPRLYAFAPLAGTPENAGAYLSIGIPKEVAFADADSTLARNLTLLGLVGLLTLLAAWLGTDLFILRRVQALVLATKRVREGDWSARVGMTRDTDELGQLAHAFDKMAASLETAQQKLLEGEVEKKRFYSEVIRAVTSDKFHLVDEIPPPEEGELLLEMALETKDDYRALRNRLREVATEAGMTKEGIGDFVLAVSEAAANAMKHAEGGKCRVYRLPDRLVGRVSDNGTGIRSENLPATILQAGFSTKVSLGMGYTLMLQLVNKVWLATTPEGTVLQLEKKIRPDDPPEENPMQDVMERFASPYGE